jgi:hypothetical protein
MPAAKPFRAYKTSSEWIKETDWELLTYNGWKGGKEGNHWNSDLIDRYQFNYFAAFSGYRTNNPEDYQRWQVYHNKGGNWDLFVTGRTLTAICDILDNRWEEFEVGAIWHHFRKRGFYGFKASEQGETYTVKLVDGAINFYEHPLECDQPGYNHSNFKPPFLKTVHPFFEVKR